MNRLIVAHVAALDFSLGAADSRHGCGIARQLQRRFDRREVLGRNQDDAAGQWTVSSGLYAMQYERMVLNGSVD
jgi:hypothetical protein